LAHGFVVEVREIEWPRAVLGKEDFAFDAGLGRKKAHDGE
jgi:hypothetical protein